MTDSTDPTPTPSHASDAVPVEQIDVGAVRISSHLVGSTASVAMSGELDLHSAGDLIRSVQHLVATGTIDDLGLDLSGLEFIDSSGLHAILRCRNHLLEHGIALRVVAVSPPVARVIHLAGLDDTLRPG
jgi:anti-anti-sigma factor